MEGSYTSCPPRKEWKVRIRHAPLERMEGSYTSCLPRKEWKVCQVHVHAAVYSGKKPSKKDTTWELGELGTLVYMKVYGHGPRICARAMISRSPFKLARGD